MLQMTKNQRCGLMALPLLLGGAMMQSAWAQNAQPIYDAGAGQPIGAPAPAVIAPLPGSDSSARAAAIAAPASAADAMAGRDAPVAGGLQPIQSDQGIRYISGGVGEDERTTLDALANQFNLHLMFARQGSGEYFAAVRVNILDTHGATVLTAESRGPWLFAQLPSGDYVVEASPPDQANLQPQRQTVHVDGSHKSKMDFYWR
jgi:hypothetical protein